MGVHRYVFGREALNEISGVRTAIDEKRHGGNHASLFNRQMKTFAHTVGKSSPFRTNSLQSAARSRARSFAIIQYDDGWSGHGIDLCQCIHTSAR